MSKALATVFESTLSIDNFDINTQLLVSPNPTLGKLSINGVAINTVEVYNALGQHILQYKNPTQNSKFTMNLEGYSKGVYLLKINSDFGVGIKKVILM